MQEGLDQVLRDTDAENPLFQAFYPEICADHGWQDDAGYGSAEHMQQVYMTVATCDCFRVKGSKVAMRSFFAWPEVVAAELLPTWHTRCLLLAFMGLQLGWFRDGKLPIGGLALKGVGWVS